MDKMGTLKSFNGVRISIFHVFFQNPSVVYIIISLWYEYSNCNINIIIIDRSLKLTINLIDYCK